MCPAVFSGTPTAVLTVMHSCSAFHVCELTQPRSSAFLNILLIEPGAFFSNSRTAGPVYLFLYIIKPFQYHRGGTVKTPPWLLTGCVPLVDEGRFTPTRRLRCSGTQGALASVVKFLQVKGQNRRGSLESQPKL